MSLASGVVLVFILFGLMIMGWVLDVQYSIIKDIMENLEGNKEILNMFYDAGWFFDFLHGVIPVFASALIITNIIVEVKSDLNPFYYGALSVGLFLTVFFLNYWIIPTLLEIVGLLNTINLVNRDWFSVFVDYWYMLVLSGFIGSSLAMVKGASKRRIKMKFGGDIE